MVASALAAALAAGVASAGHPRLDAGRPAGWYRTPEAARIAANVLSYQTPSGGWPKNIDMTAGPRPPGAAPGLATIDNGATADQMRFLMRFAAAGGGTAYGQAVRRGLAWILTAQYPSGGWPQIFPLAGGYRDRITFNDDAMVNALEGLRDAARDGGGCVDAGRREAAGAAVHRGVECILRCQIVVAGTRTAWCQQHDERTFAPAPGRSYEPAALASAESVRIVRFLMGEPPSPGVTGAVEAAVAWLRKARLPDGRWARFYEIGTDRPVFCGRDGVVRHSVDEIESERRDGYAWFTDRPAKLLSKDYPRWRGKESNRQGMRLRYCTAPRGRRHGPTGVDPDTRGVHDPCIIADRGRYYVFSTGDGLPIRRSTDLVHWERVGRVFAATPSWVSAAVPGVGALWAPDISRRNGRFHLYYAASTFGSNRSCIGLASNATLDPDAPDYGWRDEGEVIASRPGDDYDAIDPQAVCDRAGRWWLAFGSYWSGIKVVPLDAATGKPEGHPVALTAIARRPSTDIEAPFIVEHAGFYYLFASTGQCCRGAESTYEIRAGRSRFPAGPYLDRRGKGMMEGGGDLILGGDERWRGPGHCAVLSDAGQDFLVYHAYDAYHDGQPTLHVRRLRWTADGWPEAGEPVVIRGKRIPSRFHVCGDCGSRVEAVAVACEYSAGGMPSVGDRSGPVIHLPAIDIVCR
ncbi:MAG: pectate lyase [Candidatus Coatesbacteria bacterium]